ncbi:MULTISPECIES: zinc-binding dehydrogenase [unclassified Pseudoalteromonas]|uniref:zinc-binding dehydrogenase n=1 Tax=unclassified Pseudoalteromonas TaxID=194690 RepID=UPI0038640EC4
MKYISHEDSNLAFAQTNKPVLKSHEVLVKVAAIGVNRADCMQRQGKYPAPAGDSLILGLECAGTIIELGKEVEKTWLNKRIFTLCAGGAYSEYVAVDAKQLMELPDDVTMAEGAAAIQMAKSAGATVVITAGTDDKCQHAKELGVDHAINYKTTDFVEYMQANNLTANAIVDPVSGSYLNKNATIAAMDCQIVMLAFLDGRFVEVDFATLLQKRISFHASTLRNRSIEFKRNLRDDFVARFYSELADKKYDFNVYKTLPWGDANEAHAILERNENAGKVVLLVE